MSRGLGRGLDALLGGVRQQSAEDESVTIGKSGIENLPIEDIRPNPNQPRSEFDAEALEDLANSIRSQGVLQPILVRLASDGGYELVAGERRLRAAKIAGLQQVPALVKEMSDIESLAIALIENLQREDLNPIEEACGYQRLIQEFGVSQEELARQVGKSRSALANSMRLLHLQLSVQSDISSGDITAGHGRAIAAISDSSIQEELASRIKTQNLTVRQTEYQASYWKENGRLPDENASVSEQAPAEQPGRKSKRLKKGVDPRLERIARALSNELSMAVKMGGTAEEGRLTIQYATEEDLGLLLDRLGVGFEDI